MKRLVVAAVLAVLLTSCNIVITSPKDGAIVPLGSIEVTGKLRDGVSGGTVSVNGVPGTIHEDGTWSATIPSGPVGETTTVTAVYTAPNGTVSETSSTIVNGPSIPVGEFANDGVSLKFTNAGLNGLGPVINNLAGASFDISGMLLAQNPLVESTMLGINIKGNAYEAGLGGVNIAAQSTTQGVRTDIAISDMYIGIMLNIGSAQCMLELQIPSVAIQAHFDLAPLAADPSQVDVNMIGQPTVDVPVVNHEFISGICDTSTPILGPIVNAIAGGQIQGLIGDGFGSQLGDPDGSGPADSPIADAIETALAEISIAGPVGEAVQANLDAPFTSIVEQADGINMTANASFQAVIGDGVGECPQYLGAPNLSSTFAVPGPPAVLGTTTPGGAPYGLGLSISSSAFNQLLGAMTECGRINQEITEFNLGGPIPLTAGLLAGLVPQFSALDPSSPMLIKVTPTVAPYLTGAPGPGGEPAELKLSNLKLGFYELTGGEQKLWLTLAVDTPLGFDLGYDPVTEALAPTITAGPSELVKARVTQNAIGADASQVTAVFEALFPNFVADIGGSFAAFPLPAFMGLDLEVIETEKQGSNFVLYANLNPGSSPKIENVAIANGSTGNYATDSVFDVDEWRHRIRSSSSSSTIKVDFKAMLGSDACCFTGSKSANATAKYTLNFKVNAQPGEAWKVDLSQAIKGAHTLLEEDLGGANTAIQNNGVIAARGRVGAGAWNAFNFTIPAGQREVSSSNGANVPFAGANSTVLYGTGTQNVAVEVEFKLHTHSASTFFPPRAGDEAAIRLGLQDSITNGFTAGEYPGHYPRNIADDGHKVEVTLTPVG